MAHRHGLTTGWPTGTDSIDLTDPEYYTLREGFATKIARPTADGSIPPYVVEAIPLRMRTSGADALATALQDLHEKQRWATRAAMNVNEDSDHMMYYTQGVDGETYARAAFVRSVAIEPAEAYFAQPIGEFMPISLMVERHPYWEHDGTVSLPTDYGFTGPSHLYNYVSNAPATGVIGDVEARVSYFAPYWNSATSGDLDRFWMGLTPSTNFVPIWEMEDGTSGSGTTIAIDANASGARIERVSTGADAWNERVTIEVEDIASLPSEYPYGEFLWLLGAKATAGTYEVRLRIGFTGMDDDDLVRLSKVVEVNTNSYNLYNMGTAMIPPMGRRSPLDVNLVGKTVIQVWARQTSGAGSLDLDCLCPIPVDLGYLFTKSSAVGGAGITYLTYKTQADDKEIVYAHSQFTVGAAVQWRSKAFRFPPGEGRMVIAFARSSSYDISDTLNIGQGRYVPRWCSLRGAETHS